MLLLTRRVGEKVLINDDITIIVCAASGQKAKIGIEAPREISVHREEIYDSIREETKVNTPR